MSTCKEGHRLSPYLLGLLAPAERARLERHLSYCSACRRQIADMAPLAGVLRHTPFGPDVSSTPVALAEEDANEGHKEDPEENAEEDAEEDADASRRSRSRTRRRRVLLPLCWALAASAAAAAIGLGVTTSPGSSAPPATGTTLSATSPTTGVAASALLQPEPTGTVVVLRLSALPHALTCRLLVHGRDGRTEIAASWSSGYTSNATIDGTTSLPPAQVADLQVLTTGGVLLIDLPRH
jgi:anti-sigma factor RsiW